MTCALFKNFARARTDSAGRARMSGHWGLRHLRNKKNLFPIQGVGWLVRCCCCCRQSFFASFFSSSEWVCLIFEATGEAASTSSRSGPVASFWAVGISAAPSCDTDLGSTSWSRSSFQWKKNSASFFLLRQEISVSVRFEKSLFDFQFLKKSWAREFSVLTQFCGFLSSQLSSARKTIAVGY